MAEFKGTHAHIQLNWQKPPIIKVLCTFVNLSKGLSANFFFFVRSSDDERKNSLNIHCDTNKIKTRQEKERKRGSELQLQLQLRCPFASSSLKRKEVQRKLGYFSAVEERQWAGLFQFKFCTAPAPHTCRVIVNSAHNILKKQKQQVF